MSAKKPSPQIWLTEKPAILEAMQAHIPITQLLVSDQASHDTRLAHLLKMAAHHKVPVHSVPPETLSRLASHKKHLTVLAKLAPIPQPAFKTLLQDCDLFPSLLILDHLQDPHNVGAIIRTALALGLSGVIYPKDRQALITETVIKTSAGACFHLPLIQVANIAQSVLALKKKGYWIYGSSVSHGTPLPTFKAQLPWALVVGNEHKGIGPRLEKCLDDQIHIPLDGRIDSLNVSVATGIMAYSLRQTHG